MSLRKLAFGTAAISSVNVLRLLAQFLVIPILSRLLSPEDYGLIGLAMPFILFAMILTDAGVGMSLVRVPSGERRVWSTCFWLTVLLGMALAALVAVAAPGVAWAFHEPQLTSLLLVLALAVFLQALCAIPAAALQQSQRFKTTALVEIACIGAGLSTAVLVARQGGGAWALVAQQMVYYMFRVALLFACSGFRPQRAWDLAGVREHLIFGRDVIGVNLAGFLSRSLDNLIIGKALGPAAVGIYTMTTQFSRLPILIISGPLQYVLYSQLVPIRDNKEAIVRAFLMLTRLLATVVFPVMGLVAIAHAPIFTWFLSDKWAETGELFSLMAAASALQAVTALAWTIRMVIGRTDTQLRTSLEFAAVWLLLLMLCVPSGLESVALAYNFAVIFYTPRAMTLLLPHIGCSLVSYAKALTMPTAVTLVSVVAYLIAVRMLALPEFWQIVLAAVLAAAGVCAGLGLQRRMILEQLALWRRSHSSS